jgi:hypothetical protein
MNETQRLDYLADYRETRVVVDRPILVVEDDPQLRVRSSLCLHAPPQRSISTERHSGGFVRLQKGERRHRYCRWRRIYVLG